MAKGKKGKKKDKKEEVVDVEVEVKEVKIEGLEFKQDDENENLNEGKKGKGKKGKKGKEKKEKKEKKPKGKKGKKLSKKEKARLAAQQAEELKAAAEEERLRLLAEETKRLEIERILAEERAKRELEEQAIREVQLEETHEVFSTHKNNMLEMELQVRRNEEWIQYLKCDGLPDPASLSEMNTYLFVWRLDEESNTIQKAVPKTDEVVGLLSVLDELIDFPLDKSPEHVQDWIEIRNDVRREQRLHMDTATYLLMRNLETNLQLLDLNVLRYEAKSENLTFFLWGLLPLPVPGTPPEDNMGHTSECEFSELNVHVHMPQPLADMYLAIRALWVNYDHFGDLCPSWDEPSLPDDYNSDMFSLMAEEWSRKEILQLQYDEEVIKRNNQRRACLLPFNSPGGPVYKQPNIDLTRPLNPPLIQYFEPLIPPELYEPIPTPAEVINTRQEEAEEDLKKTLAYEARPNELNLRKYTILGGVLHLDLLQQPPQPKELREKYIITTLKLPKHLEAVDFHVRYVPPPPPEPGQRRLPEEIEAEIKQQEAEFEKLCLISIALPNNVLWFEPPIIALWADEEGFWSTADCHDLKFNEEKQILAFRCGRLGPLGLAVYRYTNLPFQAWDMKPCHKTGGVILSITAAIAAIDLLFKDDLVAMTQLQNGATSALQEHVGVFYKPRKLIKLLINGGVDLFPPVDAMCYVEGVASKHRAMEDHLYHCLAVLSTAFQFAWSRWNLLSGHRSIVMQMREYIDRKHLPVYSMLLVTPLKAVLVDCTEVSQTFSEEGAPGMKFFGDLYHLAHSQSSMATRKKIDAIPFQLVESLYEFLSKTKILSFS